MRPIPKRALCGCLVEASVSQLDFYFDHPEVDLVEWRLDAFVRSHGIDALADGMRSLSCSCRRPVLATNRPIRMGGFFEGDEAMRAAILFKAARAGADWIDLEADVSQEMLSDARCEGFQVLLSHHDFSATPESPILRRMVEKMAAQGPRAIKLVTFARSHDDNLRVLELIPFARRAFGMNTIAFCMGPLGRWSRVACLLLGSPWTYVQFPEQSSAAPGQYAIPEMRALLRAMAVSSER